MKQRYPETIQKLIHHLKKLPGVGSKTAERFAFELLRWKEPELNGFAEIIKEIPLKIIPCSVCSCLTQEGACPFCDLSKRDPSTLCILASPREVYAMEETGTYRGLYHIIEHLLSPLDGRHASAIKLDRIQHRIEQLQTKEVILAFDSTLEGDATALYLKQELSHLPVTISRLAFGLPVGTHLDSIDGGTLMRALVGRREI